MATLGFNRILGYGMALLTVVLLALGGITLWQGSKTQRLTLAAGGHAGESYILGQALKQVVEEHYPKIQITLLETGGTAENLRMLEEGRAQLATAQADVMAGPKARILALLYDDTLQLLVPRDSAVNSFSDLKGKTIALAQTGGQFQSFLRVAEHFDLKVTDFHFLGSTDAEADAAFVGGKADAVFRVRTLGDPSIQKLMQSGNVRFLPIDQASAMKIKNPAFMAAVIPQGAYLGSPAVPAQDLPSVAIHRTLLANQDVDEGAIRAITEVLMEQREEMMEAIPVGMGEVRLLLAQVRRPEEQVGLGAAPHPGATSFFDKDKPSFLHENADVVGLLLTVAAMLGSWLWQVRKWMQAKQKIAADHYSDRAVALMGAVQETESLDRVEEIWRELLKMLTDAVHDLDADKLSEESFDSFRSVLNIALDVTKERRAILHAGAAAKPAAQMG